MIWLTLLMAFTAQAKTVLIRGPDASSVEYQAMLKSHGDYSSPTQEYLNGHPLPAQREQLLNLFSEAQKTFLQGSTDEAKLKFTAVLSLLPRDDWDMSDREIFLQSYLRMAQLESEPGPQDRWLGLSLLLGETKYDSSLFPPPLLARRAEIAQQIPKVTLNKMHLAHGWTEILINGRQCGPKDCGLWPLYPGKVRLTVLSDQWLPQTAMIDLADFDQFKAVSVPWSEGSCDHSRLRAEAERFQNSKVFWSLDCGKTEPVTNLNLIPKLAPSSGVPALFASAKPTPIYKSTWFWVGVGTVAAVLIFSNAHRKEVREPSTTYGY